ncbi:MAG TPA: TonB family protein [Acidobacteriaceae bacterium]|jgi:protein TonB
MFEESLIESTGVIAQRKRWPVISSIGIQAVIAATAICVPLLHPEVMKMRPPLLTLVAPRMEKPPVPPPPERVRVAPTTTAAFTAPAAAQPPINSGRTFTRPSDNPSMDPPTDGPINIGATSTGPSGLLPGPTSTSPVRVVPAPAAHVGPVTVSSGVIAGLLMNPIRPIYPAIAKATHKEGTVIVQAIISKTGRIESARVVSGPAMLAGAALEAVEAARYQPYLLNNQPTEVETTITITFHMNG